MIEYFDGSPAELYNLSDDLGESTDVAGKMGEKVKEMGTELAAWRTLVGARMPTLNPKYDPTKAGQWWNRRSNKPLDIEAMRKRYESSIEKKAT